MSDLKSLEKRISDVEEGLEARGCIVLLSLIIAVGSAAWAYKQNSANNSSMSSTQANTGEKLNQIAYASYELGIYLIHQKAYEVAISEFDLAIKLVPRNSSAFMARGIAHHEQGDYDKALKDHNQAISLGGHAYAYNNRGNTYRKMGESELALEDFNKSISIDSENARVYYNLACYYSSENQVEALYNLGKALDLDGSLADRALNDPDFHKVRNLSEFRALLSDYGRRRTDQMPH